MCARKEQKGKCTYGEQMAGYCLGLKFQAGKHLLNHMTIHQRAYCGPTEDRYHHQCASCVYVKIGRLTILSDDEKCDDFSCWKSFERDCTYK